MSVRATALALSADGRLIAGTSRGSIEVVALDAKTEPIVREGHRGGTTALAVSPDGRTVASGGGDGEILLWSL